MGRLTNDDVTSLIRDIEAGLESAARPPAFSTGAAGEPPHLVWGLGSGQPLAVGVTPDGPEYRTGEYWATGYSELEATDDPWVADGVARNVAALRESMRVASERRAKLARRVNAPKSSTAGKATAGKATVDTLVAYLESPGPDRFEQLFSDAALWVDHRDDDESLVAGVSSRLDGATVTARWTAPGRLVLSGPHGERTLTPRSRETTLRALAAMVGPEFELRQWVGGIPGDTVAIVVLPAEAWAAVADARSMRARDAQFRRVHARSTIFR